MNVSSIAVWVLLNELYIEYYKSHILKHIGSSIGNVFQVDTHTAVEARGRYARLCVQIDINKPLVSTILIKDLEQLVLYEGISWLCFSCGRVGHCKESCPYIVQSPSPLMKEGTSLSPSKRTIHVLCMTVVPLSRIRSLLGWYTRTITNPS